MARLVQIAPPAGFSPRVGIYVAQLEDIRGRTKDYVEGLSPQQLSWHPYRTVESIGTLLLHIAAVEFSWIQEDIMQRPMGEEWKIAFPIRFNLPQVAGQPLPFYTGKLDSVRAETRRLLAGLADEDLARPITPLDGEDNTEATRYTIEWILYHLMEHEAHHKGQIALLKRMLPSEIT